MISMGSYEICKICNRVRLHIGCCKYGDLGNLIFAIAIAQVILSYQLEALNSQTNEDRIWLKNDGYNKKNKNSTRFYKI